MTKYEFRNDEPDIIHGRGYVYNLNYHIVWCTKYATKPWLINYVDCSGQDPSDLPRE